MARALTDPATGTGTGTAVSYAITSQTARRTK
jgi:hypothetical protein